jgi:hypothetical protein
MLSYIISEIESLLFINDTIVSIVILVPIL